MFRQQASCFAQDTHEAGRPIPSAPANGAVYTTNPHNSTSINHISYSGCHKQLVIVDVNLRTQGTTSPYTYMHVRLQGSKAPMLTGNPISATGVNSAKNPQEITQHVTSHHLSLNLLPGVSPRNVVNDEDVRTSMKLSRRHRLLGSSRLDSKQLKKC